MATESERERLVSFRLPTVASEFLDKLATSVDSTKTALLRSIVYATYTKLSAVKEQPVTLGQLEKILES